MPKAQTILYMDDTVIFHSSSNINDVERVLQQDHKQLQIWAKENRLCIHPTKTEAVLLGTHQRISANSKLDLLLGSNRVKRISHCKYLGISIDPNINFNEHVDRLYSKLSSRLGALRRMRKPLTAYAANKVYTATFLPLLDYCNVAWNSIGKTASAKLDQLQEKVAKLVLPQAAQPIRNLKWLPLTKRRDMHIALMTFKCLLGNVPFDLKIISNETAARMN